MVKKIIKGIKYFETKRMPFLLKWFLMYLFIKNVCIFYFISNNLTKAVLYLIVSVLKLSCTTIRKKLHFIYNYLLKLELKYSQNRLRSTSLLIKQENLRKSNEVITTSLY